MKNLEMGDLRIGMLVTAGEIANPMGPQLMFVASIDLGEGQIELRGPNAHRGESEAVVLQRRLTLSGAYGWNCTNPTTNGIEYYDIASPPKGVNWRTETGFNSALFAGFHLGLDVASSGALVQNARDTLVS